jgi:hypothetical protein
MEKKQTSVEWLYERLERMIPREALYNMDKKQYFEQAKAIEKEQMIEFIKKAPIKTGLLQEGGTYYRIDAESHYNETYGGNDEN